MNAAGRTSDQPFKDLRSARSAHQRSRKYPERVYTGNKRRRSNKARPARVAALKETYKQIERREWEDDWYAEWAHGLDMACMDDVTAYYRFGKNADIFDGYNDGNTTGGEDFTAWARRRIAEMRRVKEYRIRYYGHLTSPTPLSLPHTMHNTSRPGHTSATILTAPHARPHEITLPTTLSDIRAHLTLACILTPSENYAQRCRSRNLPALPVIVGFGWWGEYSWRWHRNASGCWYLGYGWACREGCEGACKCACWGRGLDGCYCEEFGVAREWEVRAPEDVQKCSLVEWVAGELREMMEDDEGVSRRRQGVVDGDGWGLEAGLGQERECGHYLEDEYVILDKEDESSEAWSVISSVDETTSP
ncbi:hypothetical protein G6011_06906 [Alternaria panax]|uniref:Uncharacterized protein n=1 Tax=Alternaria panax TaxID=48097 RepID=A0AAD4F926_9PLEO|nr:hypothetical protein G6011_06906 [Alternaria panax]